MREVEAAFRPRSVHLPHTSLVVIENSNNAAGGVVMDGSAFGAVVDFAEANGLPVHLDGARLWNAAVALSVEPRELASRATTVMVSFSKGLGCPVGSCLAGPSRLMDEAIALRRRLGGGMRQSGILSAACLYALDRNLDRLEQDHANAQMLASRLEAVHTPARNEHVNLLDLVADEAARAGAQVSGEPFSLRGDARTLRRLVRNLIENARRYASGSQIEVSLAPTDSGVRLPSFLKMLCSMFSNR